ncbi:MAG: histidine kinase dimerization/phospho-acceptor domain-containing protein [Myxococcota bacterium]
MRHDLRSPLAVVIARADLLLAEVGGPLTPSQRTSVQAIVTHAERLQRELEALAERLDARRAPDP